MRQETERMDLATSLSISTMVVTLVALVVAIAQVNVQLAVEARRKGKIDRLAIGDWAISWPQTRVLMHRLLGIFFIRSRLRNPHTVEVPFVTIGALQEYLKREARAEGRRPLDRRIVNRLVKTATESLATGSGQFSGRIYDTRETTRKKSEACWSDALDMCGIARQHWPPKLLSSMSAQTCDGVIRPANAVTNLHSIMGFARAMGLRDVDMENGNTHVTLSNGGASIYIDNDLGHGTLAKQAHFSGSPNARYCVLNEMSQQTAESVYADALWSAGYVPVADRLTPLRIPPDGRGRYRLAGEELTIIWPSSLMPPALDKNDKSCRQTFQAWATEFIANLAAGEEPTPKGAQQTSLLALVQHSDAAIVPCIRTYPKGTLTDQQVQASSSSLRWCVDHWWIDSYQELRARPPEPDRPHLPRPDVKIIGAEYVTDIDQAKKWCLWAHARESVPIDASSWDNIVSHAQANEGPPCIMEWSILVNFLQAWKLHVIQERLCAPGIPDCARDVAVCEVMVLEMALLAVSKSSTMSTSQEENKNTEVDFV
ncbi:hypothetical protein QBC44DRAFT_314645 [Cladorrhinum sp. PSN332]|nr:hypothetical protein QBC44DRAFT_314645 [Cladorrhinum sp. PSN332]